MKCHRCHLAKCGCGHATNGDVRFYGRQAAFRAFRTSLSQNDRELLDAILIYKYKKDFYKLQFDWTPPPVLIEYITSLSEGEKKELGLENVKTQETKVEGPSDDATEF